jgi:hypothetical protein
MSSVRFVYIDAPSEFADEHTDTHKPFVKRTSSKRYHVGHIIIFIRNRHLQLL